MLLRTDPLRDVDRLAEQFFGTTRRPAAPLDAYRDGDVFTIDIDLPGVDADSIDVTVERNMLRVRAERNRPQRDGVEQVIAERPMGTVTRQVFLGDSLDTDRLEASYDAGVLSLRIPVADKVRPRRIAVAAGARELPSA